jgi:hypothetical protein
VVFEEELGLGLCHQGGNTVHELDPTLRHTVGIWKEKIERSLERQLTLSIDLHSVKHENIF